LDKSVKSVNEELKRFLQKRQKGKNMRITDVSDVSGMVKNLRADVEGIFDEEVLK